MSAAVISPQLSRADKLDLAERYLTQCPPHVLETLAGARLWLVKEFQFNPYEFADSAMVRLLTAERRRRKEISQ